MDIIAQQKLLFQNPTLLDPLSTYHSFYSLANIKGCGVREKVHS